MLITKYYLLLLFVICCILVIRPLTNKALNKFFLLGFHCAIIIIVTFRSEDMADYDSYADAFWGFREGLRFEPGFHLIRIITNSLGLSFIGGFFLYSILGVTLKLRYIAKEGTLMWPALLVYLSNILITHDMVAIRAGAAASFLLMAIDYKIKGERKKAIFSIVIAILFHYSAIAFFIILLISAEKKYRKWYVLSIIISHLLAFAGIFINKYLGILTYFQVLEAVLGLHNEGDAMNFFNLLQVGHIIICVFFWINIEKLQAYSSKSLLLLKLYTIGICVMPLLAEMIAMAIRLKALFLIVEIVLIPIGFYSIFRKKILARYVTVFYAIIIFYLIMTDSQYWGEL